MHRGRRRSHRNRSHRPQWSENRTRRGDRRRSIDSGRHGSARRHARHGRARQSPPRSYTRRTGTLRGQRPPLRKTGRKVQKGTAVIKAVRGTRDILPPSSAVWNHVEAVARRVLRAYNYQEIRTPILEETALFARGVGTDTELVSKEMYTFDDEGTSLTLRPENTAPVIRSWIEHRMDQLPGLQKLYYIGPMFRRERPQKGRYRQFYQIGAEAIGSDSPVVDAEVIEMVTEILKGSGLEDFELLINSVGHPECRAVFVAALKEKLAGVEDSTR